MTVVTAAQGSESRLLYKKQAQLGQMATGDYKRTRWNTHGIIPQIGSVESNEIRDDRQVEVFRHGNKSVAGPLVQELIYGVHDWLLESGMFNSFDTNGHLGIGKVAQVYSIEDGATDIDKHQMFYDMLVSKLSWDFQPEAMTMLTCDMIGLQPLAPSSSQGGTPIAADGGQPFDSFHAAVYDNVEGSGSELATITSLKIEVDNKAAARYVLGQQTGALIERESGAVSGTFTALYDSELFLNRFLNETEFPLVLGQTDLDGRTQTYRMCRVKMATGGAPVVDKKSRIINADFRALYNPDLGYSLRIER